MQRVVLDKQSKKLSQFCDDARKLVMERDYNTCYDLTCAIMREYPDAPQPHNIMGILLEKTGQHPEAMKHFRVALVLDPTYRPAIENLDTYGTFHSSGRCVFDESECVPEHQSNYTIVYDDQKVGRVVRRI